MGHKKHPKLARPKMGKYARHELAILGTNCGMVQKIVTEVIAGISTKYQIAYVDAEHNRSKNDQTLCGASLQQHHLDKIDYQRYDVTSRKSEFLSFAVTNNLDLAILNGNHWKALEQIVVVDPKKEASLRKRADQLTNVIGIIQLEDGDVPSYVAELIPNLQDLPVYTISQVEEIQGWLLNHLGAKTPEICGLVLGGGKSVRMGEDKATLDYHGEEQWKHLSKLMTNHCSEVYVSCRDEQENDYPNKLLDSFLFLGPMGGILSAFRHSPDCAWLTIACDLPFLDDKTIGFLIENRDPSKIATCFHSPATGFPEPLVTLWEPKAYPILLQYLSRGYACPRKILINNDICEVQLENPEVIQGANTPEERKEALAKLAGA